MTLTAVICTARAGAVIGLRVRARLYPKRRIMITEHDSEGRALVPVPRRKERIVKIRGDDSRSLDSLRSKRKDRQACSFNNWKNCRQIFEPRVPVLARRRVDIAWGADASDPARLA